MEKVAGPLRLPGAVWSGAVGGGPGPHRFVLLSLSEKPLRVMMNGGGQGWTLEGHRGAERRGNGGLGRALEVGMGEAGRFERWGRRGLTALWRAVWGVKREEGPGAFKKAPGGPAVHEEGQAG